MNDAKFDKMMGLLEVFQNSGISHAGKGLENVLAFQDVIGTSTNNDLVIAWKKMDESLKRVFIWSVTSTCGFEIAQNIIDWTMGFDLKKRVQKIYDEDFEKLEMEWNALHQAQAEFQKEKEHANSMQVKMNQILAIIEK